MLLKELKCKTFSFLLWPFSLDVSWGFKVIGREFTVYVEQCQCYMQMPERSICMQNHQCYTIWISCLLSGG